MEKKKEKKSMLKTFVLLSLWLMFMSFQTSAATYMTISSVEITSPSPYIKDQYSITLKVTYSAPQGVSAGNCRAKISSLPSGWKVLDDYNVNFKTLTTCSGSTTFEIMPTTTGSFEGSQIVVEVRGTDTSGQSTINPATASPSGTILVKSQPVLDLVITGVSSTNITTNSSVILNYQITNTGGAETASTRNLRLILYSTPLSGLSFTQGTSTLAVGDGTLDAGGRITGSVTLKTTDFATSNTLSYILQATADNTDHDSSRSGFFFCEDCLGVFGVNFHLSSGWNLISIPLTLSQFQRGIK